MARAPKLKVFRLPIGFHDAYVATPTKKAAIEAWGSDADVFRRGQAEQVTEPALTRAPLARPGEVIKKLRGTAAEQLAALGEAEPPPVRRRDKSDATRPKKAKSAKRNRARPKPRPSRAALEKAQAALAAAGARHEKEIRALAEREAALARDRDALQTKQAKESQRLEGRVEKAEQAYREALRRWRG